MRVRATTGECGNRLFSGFDLVSLSSDGLRSGPGVTEIFTELSVWHSSTLGDLISGIKNTAGNRSYLFEQAARHVVNLGHRFSHPCQYGRTNGIKCIRFLDDSGNISEVRFRNGKIYERMGVSA